MIYSFLIKQNGLHTECMSICMLFAQYSKVLGGQAEIFIGTNIFIMVLNWFVLICFIKTCNVYEYHIIWYSCVLGF